MTRPRIERVYTGLLSLQAVPQVGLSHLPRCQVSFPTAWHQTTLHCHQTKDSIRTIGYERRGCHLTIWRHNRYLGRVFHTNRVPFPPGAPGVLGSIGSRSIDSILADSRSVQHRHAISAVQAIFPSLNLHALLDKAVHK